MAAVVAPLPRAARFLSSRIYDVAKTKKVTARLQVTGFPFFSLLPAGMGELVAGRLDEEARETRAETRRRVALDEIDHAKEQQARSDACVLSVLYMPTYVLREKSCYHKYSQQWS